MRELVAGHGFTAHIRSRGEEIDLKERKPDWKARRWVVEACHSWLNRNRGILIRWSKKEGPEDLEVIGVGVPTGSGTEIYSRGIVSPFKS